MTRGLDSPVYRRDISHVDDPHVQRRACNGNEIESSLNACLALFACKYIYRKEKRVGEETCGVAKV